VLNINYKLCQKFFFYGDGKYQFNYVLCKTRLLTGK